MPAIIRLLLHGFLMMLLAPAIAWPHDPSAWGGSYRSRDMGMSWFPADAGLFISGAMAIAVDPSDSNHLLYASDARLMRSRNGGRDWQTQGASVLVGTSYAAAFGAGGNTALAAGSNILLRNSTGADDWHEASLSASAFPVHTIVSGTPNQFYVGGHHGVWCTDDDGISWHKFDEGLPDAPVTQLQWVAASAGSTAALYALSDGHMWRHDLAPDGAWKELMLPQVALPEAFRHEAGISSGTLWLAMADHIYASANQGRSWQQAGSRLPEVGTNVRGIAVAGDSILLATHRGAYRSDDRGARWGLIEGNLPLHLEAAGIWRDPNAPATAYIGFSLTPYSEVWRRAEGGGSLLGTIDGLSLAGAAAFLMLLIGGGLFLVAKLNRQAPRVESSQP